MRYCQECGKKIKKYAEICMHCGASNEVDIGERLKEKLSDTITKTKEYSEKAVEKGNEIKNSEEFKETTKNVSNKAKVMLDIVENKAGRIINKLKNVDKRISYGILAILVVLIVGLSIATKPQTQESIVNKFEDAIIDQDLGKLKSIVKSEDKRLEVTEKNLKGIIEYYKLNPSNLNTDMNYLKNYSLEEQYGEVPFKLIQEKAGLKEKYYISLSPKYIEFKCKYNNIKVDLSNGEDIIKEDLKSGEIGPFIPGQYKLVITSRSEFSDLKKTQDIDLFYGEMLNYIDINVDINQTKIVSNYPEAIIYINGKNTQKTAEQLGTIAGLKNGTKIYGVIDVEGKQIKSNEQEVSNSSNVSLKFDYTKPPTVEEARSGISEVIGNYLEEFAYAVNYGDFSYIEEYIENNSNLYKEQQKNVPGIYERGITEKYISHEITDIQYDEVNKIGSVNVNEVYEIIKEDSSEEKTFSNKYTFKYDENSKKYKLTSLSM